MESKVNPAIETFYKAFPIFNNRTVYIDMVVYSKQTYRTEDTLIQAQELIKKLELPLVAIYNAVSHTLSVKLV